VSEPFDAEEFAATAAEQLEYRIIRIEEVIAARWPRSLFLRWRLAREIRASVAQWNPAYIPRGDFAGRRFEAAGQATREAVERRHRAWRERQAQEDAHGDGPGEGLLP
jgi:hypothetical protein